MTNEEIVREVYAALNRDDIPALRPYFDSEVQRIEPEGFPMSGTYSGIDAMMKHFTEARNTWAEGTCQPEKIQIAGEKFVVYVKVHVRLKDRTDWIEGNVVDGFIVRNGKIIFMRTFTDSRKALEWAEI
ncbi:nuclear transport factor 2 family protein [Bdellovibrio bacteriovorus]|uniref:SnoaL-like domain-containing protein n=1 Tax=Bdellovibrio bacteriovorus str. Tiberius TaxID=1069642 RepID=K7YMM3_BDEBC|nr:nuclear transport factor 2 family protein [Bdellovibrio bacteriovorus]AFY01041.1 hypothetical protein Bdt_1343 [Bdellovibrio bacteriovorus str. Tiberius]